MKYPWGYTSGDREVRIIGPISQNDVMLVLNITTLLEKGELPPGIKIDDAIILLAECVGLLNKRLKTLEKKND